ncbi:hypothetical protein ACOMHN_035285 [Nucella lapillus]
MSAVHTFLEILEMVHGLFLAEVSAVVLPVTAVEELGVDAGDPVVDVSVVSVVWLDETAAAEADSVQGVDTDGEGSDEAALAVLTAEELLDCGAHDDLEDLDAPAGLGTVSDFDLAAADDCEAETEAGLAESEVEVFLSSLAFFV